MSSLKGITPLLASSKQILSEKKHAATKNLHLAPASVGLEAIFFLKLFFFWGGVLCGSMPQGGRQFVDFQWADSFLVL